MIYTRSTSSSRRCPRTAWRSVRGGTTSSTPTTQEPYDVWHRSKPLYGGDVETYLNNADIVLSTPGFGCGVIGMMVVETETTVSVAIVVVDPTPDATASPSATPDPAATSPESAPNPTATPTPTPTPTGFDFRCVRRQRGVP